VGFEESAVPNIVHTLTNALSELNERIAELESNRNIVQQRIDKGIRVPDNQNSLSEINDRLGKAYAARTFMEDSCCSSQSCNIEYF
jgi:hypothetical protein